MKLIVVLLYLSAVFAIGIVASRSIKTVTDYLIGNRKFNTYVTAISAGASDMSGWLMLALPGLAFTSGVTAIWLPIGLTIGAYLNWKFIAQRLRVYTEEFGDAVTIPTYFSNRFKDTSGTLKLVTGFATIIFFTIYVASALIACSMLLQSIFKIDYTTALLISTFVIVFYTSIGGFLAVNWADVLQGTLMLFALLIVPIAACSRLGGLSTAINVLEFHGVNLTDPFHKMSWIYIASMLSWGIGYFGQLHISVRFMAAESPNIINRARLICMSWMVLSLLGAFFIGILGNGLFGSSLQNPEAIFLESSDLLFSPAISGVLFAAVLSAIMSTVSAQILISSTALVEDISMKFIRSDHKLFANRLLLNKIAVVIVALIAMAFAYNDNRTILELVAFAWAGLGASFGPLIIYSLYCKYPTKK